MVSNFWFIGDHGDFETTRSGRVGASDVPALFSNPENPSESLAAYKRTALTVYQEKIGELQRSPAELSAEMGNFLENKNLELTIRYFYSYEEGLKFRLSKEQYESDCAIARINGTPIPSARGYQTGGPFLHSVQYFVDGMIVHPDCVYIGNPELSVKKERFVKYEGIRIDMSKPFLIEAKSAKKYAAKRPHGSLVKGYDFTLLSWHGIPLKHYFQTQFQMSLFRVDFCILSLISDTSDFHVWKIKGEKKKQGQIIDVVGKMVRHIQDKTFPKELAINTQDVVIMNPDIQKDFIMLSGDKLKLHKEACKKSKEAKRQIKNWTKIDKDALACIAVIHKDFEEVRDGSVILSKWVEKKGSTGIAKPEGTVSKESVLDWIKKNDKPLLRSLENRGMIKTGKPSRYISVKWGDDEDEGGEE
ncbi:MAG: hypothetical protein PF518_16300 [Spirochaetaceae bacterium]|nr:hypothetical protein [Spirochaetaceae bacterium]